MRVVVEVEMKVRVAALVAQVAVAQVRKTETVLLVQPTLEVVAVEVVVVQ